MKRGGGLGGGGFKPKRNAPPPRAQEDGIRVVRGRVHVRDREYLKVCHEKVRPLALEPELGASTVPVMDLHHGPNATKSSRRTNDAAVVPLWHDHHIEGIEMSPAEERNLGRLFGLWSAFHYWCHKTGDDAASEGAAQRFLDWTLRRMMEEHES